MEISKWKVQLLKGAAELAVLSTLDRRPCFGLEIIDRISSPDGFGIAGGTIYPMLNRLERENKITSRWLEQEGVSNPRKYYSLTPEGAALLSEMKTEWRVFSASLDRLVNSKEEDNE